MTGLQLPRNHIVIFGSLLLSGAIANGQGPDVSLEYLTAVHAHGFKILAIAEDAYDTAKEQDGNIVDGRKWKGMRIEKVSQFWEVLKLAFATTR